MLPLKAGVENASAAPLVDADGAFAVADLGAEDDDLTNKELATWFDVAIGGLRDCSVGDAVDVVCWASVDVAAGSVAAAAWADCAMVEGSCFGACGFCPVGGVRWLADARCCNAEVACSDAASAPL